MKKIGILLSVLIMMIGFSASANGSLIDMNDGTIYDTDTQLSWLKDAGAGGVQTWANAMSWAASLNGGGGFAGLVGWRLPDTDPTCNGDGIGYNCIDSEMGHLYYTELGNVAGGLLTNVGPFANLHIYYWSGSEYAPYNAAAWTFSFDVGYQVPDNKTYYGFYYAWAVCPGGRNIFNFSGLFSPLDKIPIVNTAKAGQAIPIKWLLTDSSGVGISDSSSFAGLTSYPISCGNFSGDPTDAVEEVSSGNSGLQYLGDGYWQFNWKTPKTYSSAGQQCRVMVLSLSDGSSHYAYFKFTK